MKLLHDRILIKPVPREEFRAGLQLLGDDQYQRAEGTVVDVGPGVPLHNIRINITCDSTEQAMQTLKEVVQLIERGREMQLKPGDYVTYGEHAGTRIMINGEQHLIIREADVFGVLPKEDAVPE